MAKETVYNNTLVSGAADETLTYTRYVKDESSGKSTKELLDEKVNKTDQLGTTQIADKAVTTEKLENESVTTDKLDAASVTTDKVADANITTSKLADSSVETEKINNKAVTTDKLNDGAVDNTKLSPNAVTSEKIKDESIITEKLNDRAVTTEKVEEKAITNTKIGDSAVDGRTISEASVEKKHLANDSVATEKLQDSAITSDKIHTDAVTEEKIKDSSVSNSKLADNSVGTSKIKDGNITNEKVANNTLTLDKLDPELRKSIQAATGLPENLVETIQDVDKEVKTLHSKDTDLQSQITDKQQQISAHNKDIELLQTRSTQMELTINNIAATGGASVANTVAYTNTTSGLESVNAQGAIDELAAKNKSQDATISAKAKKTDVQAAVSELKEKDSALSAEIAKKANDSDVTSKFTEESERVNGELAKKANAEDISAQMQTEQERVNAEFAKKFDKESILQESGDAEDKVMSQKAVSAKLSDLALNTGLGAKSYSTSNEWSSLFVDFVIGNEYRITVSNVTTEDSLFIRYKKKNVYNIPLSIGETTKDIIIKENCDEIRFKDGIVSVRNITPENTQNNISTAKKDIEDIKSKEYSFIPSRYFKELYIEGIEPSKIKFVKLVNNGNGTYRVSFRGETTSNVIAESNSCKYGDIIHAFNNTISIYAIVDFDQLTPSFDKFIDLELSNKYSIIDNFPSIQRYKENINNIVIRNYNDNIHLGEGVIDGERVKLTGNYKINYISILGNTCFIKKGVTSKKSLFINNSTFYHKEGDIATGLSELENVTSTVIPAITNNKEVVLSASAGYNQLIVVINIIKALDEWLQGDTKEEKLKYLKDNITSIVVTFNGWIESSDNKGWFKQSNANTLEWVGSVNFSSSVPTSSSRTIGSSFIDSDGNIKIIIYTNLEGVSKIHFNGFDFDINSNLPGIISSVGIPIENTSNEYKYIINGKEYNIPYQLNGIENICDEMKLTNKTARIVKRIGVKKLEKSITGATITSSDNITLISIPTSYFPNYISGNNNIRLISPKFGYIEYGSNPFFKYIHLDGDIINIYTAKKYNSIEEGLSDLADSIVLYNIRNVYYNITFSEEIFNENSEDISIKCSEYLNAIVEQNLTYGAFSKDKSKGVRVYKNLSYKNFDGFKDTTYTNDKTSNIITVQPEDVGLDFYGCGAALTQSSAYMLSKLNAERRKTILTEMFSPYKGNFSILRLCFGESDFRLGSDYYTYDDIEEGEDYALEHFSIGEESSKTKDYQYIIPILREILSINPSIKIIGCPWKYPKWFWGKHGETLVYNEQIANTMANYLLKAIDAYNNIGIRIFGVSVVNEPEFHSKFTVENHQDLISNYVGPLLKSKYPQIKIMGFESNYREEEWYNTISSANDMYIDAIAVHTYNGKVNDSNFVKFRQKYRNLGLFVTERRCMQSDSEKDAFTIMYKEIAHDALKANGQLIVLWNLALDENGNPAGGGNTGRRGVITIPKNNSTIVIRNKEYYMLESLSYNMHNSHIIGSTSLPTDKLYSISMKNNKKIRTVIMNGDANDTKVTIGIKDEFVTVLVPSYDSLVIEKKL